VSTHLYLRTFLFVAWANCRARLQKLIVSGVGGKDQFVFRITQLRESPEFRDFREKITFASHGDDDLPELWFDLGFVEFLKDNYSTFPYGWSDLGRIQRSLERTPESFDVKQSRSLGMGVMVDGVVSEAVAVSPDQSKYVNSLEIRLRSSEADVKSKEANLLALNEKLNQQVSSK
jgi:hypothetical protein